MKKQKKRYCKFYIARHGETIWNTQKIMQGHNDSPLTENGVNQAKKVGKMLTDIKFDHAFSSDLIRAKKQQRLFQLIVIWLLKPINY